MEGLLAQNFRKQASQEAGDDEGMTFAVGYDAERHWEEVQSLGVGYSQVKSTEEKNRKLEQGRRLSSCAEAR